MFRWVTAMVLGLATTAVASPRVDCAVQELIGAEHAMVSIDNVVFELSTLDDLPKHILSPEDFCAFMPQDFEAFILPVPRLPDETPAEAPLPTISGEMIEPVTAHGLTGLKSESKLPDAELGDGVEIDVVVEQVHALEHAPLGLDEPAPSPSREGESVLIAGGCAAAPGRSTSWFGLLALLALVPRRAAR